MRFMVYGLILFLFLSILLGGIPLSFAADSDAESKSLFPADLLQISNTEAFSKYVFLVDKSERKLLVFEHEGETIRQIYEIPADIGKNGGNKMKRDDHRTPEGIYFFQEKKSPPEIPFDQYGKMAFTTDYPNLFDLREGKTGSGIWMHSIPETVPLTRGSRGCVVIRNDVLQKISDFIKLKETPIVIHDKIEYINKAEHDKRRQALSDYLNGWKQAWESMDVEKYMNYYGEDFKAPGFNFNSWKRHKTNLKNRYKYIKVTLSQPFLLLHKDQLIVKSLQKYQSNEHTDYGIKTLHALMINGQYKIIREDWVPSTETGATTTTLSPDLSASPTPASEVKN